MNDEDVDFMLSFSLLTVGLFSRLTQSLFKGSSKGSLKGSLWECSVDPLRIGLRILFLDRFRDLYGDVHRFISGLVLGSFEGF